MGSPPKFSIDETDKAPTMLAELNVFDTQSVTETDALIGVSVTFGLHRFYPHTFHRETTVRVRVAYVQLKVEGCTIARETGETAASTPAIRERQIERTQSTTEGARSSRSGGSDGTAKLSPFGPSGAAKRTSGKTREQSRNSDAGLKEIFTQTDRIFTRYPNNTWKVSDYRGIPLEGFYSTEDHFCKAVFGGESGTITASLTCYPRDLEIEMADDGSISHKAWHFSENHRAVIKALVGKELRSVNKSGQPLGGEVVLAKSVLSFEDTKK